MVLNNNNKLQSSGHPINGLRQSNPVKGQINTTNINKLSRSNNSGLLSNNRGLRIWYNLAGKTL